MKIAVKASFAREQIVDAIPGRSFIRRGGRVYRYMGADDNYDNTYTVTLKNAAVSGAIALYEIHPTDEFILRSNVDD